MRNVVVTGGAKGIGEAICRIFAQNGDRVFICYNASKIKAEDLQNELKGDGYEAIALHLDVNDADEIQIVSKKISEEFGGADVLINNAGICQEGFFADLNVADIKKMIDTNLTGALLVTRAFLPHMLTKKSGRIISVSSIWGDVGGSCESHYSASKAGLIGFTKALAKEIGGCGITVNAVNPGCIMTDMMADYTDEDIKALKEQTPTGVIGTPMDVANAVFFLAKKESAFITGVDLPVDGGFGR